MTGGDDVLRNTILNAGSSVAYFFFQWLTTVLAVRLASFEVAGVYALAISFSNLFYFLALFGIRNYQVSDIAQRFSDGQYAGARLTAATLSVVMFAFAAFAMRLTGYTLACYGVYMLFKLGEAYTEGYFSLLQQREEYGRLALSYTSKGVVSTLLFAVTLAISHHLLLAIVVMTAGYGVCVLVLDVPHIKSMDLGRPIFHGCGDILRHCLPLLLVSLSVPIMNYVTRYAIEQEMDHYLVGQYSSLSSVLVVMGTFAGAVFVVFLPRVSSWYREGSKALLRRFCWGALLAMALVGMAAVGAGKFLGPWVCQAIFGPDILENIDLLIPLLVTATMLMVKSFFSCMLIPLERRWALLVGEGAGAVLCVLTAMPLTRSWGMQGANASYLLGTAVQAAVLGICVAFSLHAQKNAPNNK